MACSGHGAVRDVRLGMTGFDSDFHLQAYRNNVTRNGLSGLLFPRNVHFQRGNTTPLSVCHHFSLFFPLHLSIRPQPIDSGQATRSTITTDA
jgi:hypothetical protein